MRKQQKTKTTKQLILESKRLLAKARRNLRAAEQSVSECCAILALSK
jgi:ribosome-interacting GTPase 1